MKKIIIILMFSFLLTGCFGEAGSGIITNTCTKVTEDDGIIIKEERIIKNENNNVILVMYHNTVTNNGDDKYFKALKNSYTSEVSNLSSVNVDAKIDLVKDKEFVVTYNFEYGKLSDEIKTKYDLTELNHNQVKKYEEQGFKCK